MARDGPSLGTCEPCLESPTEVMNLLLGVLVEVVRVVATAEQEGRVVRNLPLGTLHVAVIV